MPTRPGEKPDALTLSSPAELAHFHPSGRIFLLDSAFAVSDVKPVERRFIDCSVELEHASTHLVVSFEASLIQLQFKQKRSQTALIALLTQAFTGRPAHLLQQMHSHPRADRPCVDKLILVGPRLTSRGKFLLRQWTYISAPKELTWCVFGLCPLRHLRRLKHCSSMSCVM